MLYNLNLHDFMCQLHLNKAGKNKTWERTKQLTTTSCHPPALPLDIKICSEKKIKISFNLIFWNVANTDIWKKISFFFMIEWYSIVYVYHISFIHLLIDT